MKSLFLLLNLCILSAALSAQQPALKTIYQELKISPGCKLSRLQMYRTEEETMVAPIDRAAEETTAAGPSILSVIESSRPLFKLTSRFAGQPADAASPPVTMANGNTLFKEGELFGLKTSTGNILIKPSFQYTIPDGRKGFVGYKDAACNYYDLNGKKLFPADYYFIQPTAVNTFIVQTAKGFGVVDAMKKTIIPASFYKIKVLEGAGQFFYKIYTEKEETFYLSRNTKDTIWVSMPYQEPDIINAGYWMAFGTIIDIKAGRKLICDPQYYTEVVSRENQLASVHNNGKKYLINFKGQLLNNTSFKEIYSPRKNGLCLAAVETPGDNRPYGRGSLWGILNNKGSWVVKPAYTQLSFLNDFLLGAAGADGAKAIISREGKILTPFKYTDIRAVDDSLLLGVVQAKDTVQSDLIRVSDLKIIRANLPYRSIAKEKLCDGNTYIAELKRGECWLNKEFVPLLKRPYTRVFYGPDNQSVIAADFFNNRSGSESQLYDCKGAIRQFTIEGKTYNTFNSYTWLSKDLSHLLLIDGTGYFLLSDGSSVPNNSHWQNIVQANNKDQFITMAYGGKFGIINGDGVTIIPPVFEYISPYDPQTGLASYNYNDKQKGYITPEGELLFGDTYEDCDWLGFGLFKVKQQNKWGVVNRNNKVIVPVDYAKIELNGGNILAGPSDKYDFAGKPVD